MKTKLAAIWKILTNNYWMLFVSKGDVVGVTPHNIEYMRSIIDMADRFKSIGKKEGSAK